MGDSFQTGNGNLTQKQEGYISNTNGELNQGQASTLATDMRNGGLSEKLSKQAPKSHGNTVIRTVVSR